MNFALLLLLFLLIFRLFGVILVYLYITHFCMVTKKGSVAFIYGAIALLLLLCLFDMPYGYYSFVQFVSAAAFCLFAYVANQSGNKDRMIAFIVLAILFQPFLKVPLGRVIWNIVDVVVAGYLVYLLINTSKDRV